MAKVLLVIGDAAEVLDTFYPLFRIREEGHEVVVAGPAKRVYHLVLHERPEGWDITRETPGYHLAADIAFKDIRADDYSGLVISGGRAPEYLRYDPDLMRVVRSFFFRDLPVASVCHGIEVVAAAGVLRGRTVTTVAKCQFDAEGGGATYMDREVVVSGNLVTARTWHDNAPFMREFLTLLNRIAPPPGVARRAIREEK
jgi:protease I